MACGTHGRIARKQNLPTAAGRFLLSDEEAEAMTDNMVKIVRTEWDATLRLTGASDKDCASIASALIYEGFFYEI